MSRSSGCHYHNLGLPLLGSHNLVYMKLWPLLGQLSHGKCWKKNQQPDVDDGLVLAMVKGERCAVWQPSEINTLGWNTFCWNMGRKIKHWLELRSYPMNCQQAVSGLYMQLNSHKEILASVVCANWCGTAEKWQREQIWVMGGVASVKLHSIWKG